MASTSHTLDIRAAIIQRLRQRLEAHRSASREDGSLLFDVLIGMSIIGLLSLISVSTVNGHRQRAYESGAISDAHGLATEVLANYTDQQAYPDSISTDGHDYTYAGPDSGDGTFDQHVSNGNAATFVTNGSDFCVTVTHGGDNPDAWAVFDSSTGQTKHGRGSAAPEDACSVSGGSVVSSSDACTVYFSVSDDAMSGYPSINASAYADGPDGATRCEAGLDDLNALYTYLDTTFTNTSARGGVNADSGDYGEMRFLSGTAMSVSQMNAAVSQWITANHPDWKVDTGE